jgi:uncharacterized protein (DUF4415 family)
MRKPMRPEMHPELRPDLRPEMRPPMRPLTDEDGEVRELTAEDFKGMRPLREVDPGLIEAVAEHRRKRGRPKSPAPKIYIGLRMSPDVVESVKASGPGYNSRVEQALRKAGFGAAMEDPLAELSRLVEYSHRKTKPARKVAKADEMDLIAAVAAATKHAAKQAAKPPAPARKHRLKAKEPVTPATAKKRA